MQLFHFILNSLNSSGNIICTDLKKKKVFQIHCRWDAVRNAKQVLVMSATHLETGFIFLYCQF